MATVNYLLRYRTRALSLRRGKPSPDMISTAETESSSTLGIAIYIINLLLSLARQPRRQMGPPAWLDRDR